LITRTAYAVFESGMFSLGFRIKILYARLLTRIAVYPHIT